MKQIVLTLLLAFGSAFGDFQYGELVGFELDPVNKSFEILRMGGHVEVGASIGALIPLHLQGVFIETLGNVSLSPRVRFDPVSMELYEKPQMQIMNPAVQAVINFAAQFVVNLINTAVDRLHSEIFGSGRAARSTDIAIYNTLDKKLRIVGSPGCHTGILTSKMLPDFEIPAKSCAIYGVESHGFLSPFV